MGKMILLFCLIAGSGKGFLQIPRPYLVGLEAVNLQGGFGMYTRHDWPFIAGISILEPKFYWGQYGDLLAGCEFVHGCFSYGTRIIELPDGYAYGEEFSPSTWEILTLKFGVAILGPPDKTLLSACCARGGIKPEYFIPRFEISTGITPVSFHSYGHPTYLTIRNEARLHPLSLVSLKIEHRFKPGFNQDSVALKNSLTLMLCLNMGWDIFTNPPEVPEEMKEQ